MITKKRGKKNRKKIHTLCKIYNINFTKMPERIILFDNVQFCVYESMETGKEERNRRSHREWKIIVDACASKLSSLLLLLLVSFVVIQRSKVIITIKKCPKIVTIKQTSCCKKEIKTNNNTNNKILK